VYQYPQISPNDPRFPKNEQTSLTGVMSWMGSKFVDMLASDISPPDRPPMRTHHSTRVFDMMPEVNENNIDDDDRTNRISA
jgi:hypothetical protein